MLMCTCNSVYDYYEGDFEDDYEEDSDEISTTILPKEVSEQNEPEGSGKDDRILSNNTNTSLQITRNYV